MKLHVPIRQRLKVAGLIFLFGMSCGVLHAQNPLVKQWDKRFGGSGADMFTSFKQTLDSGFILGGYSNSDSSGDKTQNCWDPLLNNIKDDYWVVKIDSIGNKQWDKTFGGLNIDELTSLQQTTDSGYILGGYSHSAKNGDKTQNCRGGYDYWIVKIDLLGNKQWDKRFGGTDDDYLYSLYQTFDGGYLLGGLTHSDSTGDVTQHCRDTTLNPLAREDYWIVKIDSIGNKQWDKRFGGASNERLYAVQQTSDSGYILGGWSYSDISGDKTQTLRGAADYWIVKTDALGNKQWDKDFGGSNDDAFHSLQQTEDGGYILGGWSRSNNTGDKTQNSWGSRDYWIVKIDSLGNKEWDKDFGGTGEENEFGNITQTSDKGYLLSGESDSPIGGDKTENNLYYVESWIIKTDSIGNKQLDKTIQTGGINGGSSIIKTTDSSYTISEWICSGPGGYQTQPHWGWGEYWIVKFMDTTQIIAVPFIGVMSSDTSFCEKHCINFFDLSTNNPTSWQWFFPGSDSLTSTLQNPTNICYNSYGSFDVTLIACNAAGCDTLLLPGFINEYPAPTPTITQSNDTLFSSPGVAYQWWSVDSGIIAGANNYYYIPTQGGSYFVIVTDTTGCEGASNTIIITAINSPLERGQGCVITPNPNNGSFTITLTSSITKDFSLSIINPTGQTIFNKQGAIGKGQQVVDVNMDGTAKGLYMIEVINGGKVYRGKFMKD
ncbi:MAG: T9SS type A sorting domain-containing protein [Bacteroidia bacterium]